MGRNKSKVSISDVAKMAGVSIATVSRVLTGSASVVEETRDRVMAAISELKYVNEAKSSKYSKEKLILVSIPSINHQLYTDLILGIYDHLEKQNYSPLIMHSLKDAERERKIYQTAINNHFSGAILISPKSTMEDIMQLSSHMPVVQCFDYIPISGVSAIKIDDEHAAFDATTYLINKGHKKIAFITSDEKTTSSYNREIGYRRALEVADIRYNPDLIFESPYDFNSNREQIRNVLQHYKSMDAVLCTGDYIACQVLKQASELGISVPDELSVMGFDDIKMHSLFSPALTTVFQDAYSIGYYASVSLLNKVDPDDKRGGIISNIEYKIIERDSVADKSQQ